MILCTTHLRQAFLIDNIHSIIVIQKKKSFCIKKQIILCHVHVIFHVYKNEYGILHCNILFLF